MVQTPAEAHAAGVSSAAGTHTPVVTEMGTALQKLDEPGHEVATTQQAALLTYNPDAPSEEWGWHGDWSLFAARGSRLLLLSFTAVILLMIDGNHVSRVEDWYLGGIGLFMLAWIASREARARRQRRLRP